MAIARLTRRARWGSARRASQGQSMVEFMLALPLFLVVVIGLIEFAVALTALLAINFAGRDAALLAAETGSQIGADCVVLRSIEGDVGPPSSATRISEVRVYRADENGDEMTGEVNVWTRTGSTTCPALPDGTIPTIPYTLDEEGYPEPTRCNVLAGCDVDRPLDTVGVMITYNHAWISPLSWLVTMGDPGFEFSHSNAIRMEPVL